MSYIYINYLTKISGLFVILFKIKKFRMKFKIYNIKYFKFYCALLKKVALYVSFLSKYALYVGAHSDMSFNSGLPQY